SPLRSFLPRRTITRITTGATRCATTSTSSPADDRRGSRSFGERSSPLRAPRVPPTGQASTSTAGRMTGDELGTHVLAEGAATRGIRRRACPLLADLSRSAARDLLERRCALRDRVYCGDPRQDRRHLARVRIQLAGSRLLRLGRLPVCR